MDGWGRFFSTPRDPFGQVRFRALEQVFRSLRYISRVIIDGFGWSWGVVLRY